MGERASKVALLMLVAAVAPADVRGAAASGTSAIPAASLQGSPTVVTLITGDRVALGSTADGRPVVAFNPPGGPQAGGGFQTLVVGGHVYVIPMDAAGYLGAPLDLSLFDVTALAAAGPAASSIPLALDIAASSGTAAATALPGIAITAGGTATQPRSEAVRFGRALSADVRARKQGAPSSLFAGIDRIAIAGSPRSATAGSLAPAGQPAGKLYTLTVKGFDQNGQKVFGNFGTIYNVDDGNTFLAAQAFFNGTFSYSVPAGNYQVTALITTATSPTEASFAFVTSPQVTVKSSTTVVLEARKTSRVGVTVPDPDEPGDRRDDPPARPGAGPNFVNSFTSFGPTPMYVSPTQAVTVGQQYFYPYFRLGDAAGALDRYVYDVQLEYIGAIPGTVSPTLRRGDLATVDARYHSSTPGRGELDGRLALAPWQASAGFTPTRLAAPLTRTEYVLPLPDARWLQVLITNEQEFAGFATDNWRAPAPASAGLGLDRAARAARDRAAGRGRGAVLPGVPLGGHAEHDAVLRMSIRRETAPLPTLASSPTFRCTWTARCSTGRPRAARSSPLSPAPATYQLVMDVSRDAAWWPTTTRTHTEWTFASSERAADPLPPGWTCGGKGGGGGGGKGATRRQGGARGGHRRRLQLRTVPLRALRHARRSRRRRPRRPRRRRRRDGAPPGRRAARGHRGAQRRGVLRRRRVVDRSGRRRLSAMAGSRRRTPSLLSMPPAALPRSGSRRPTRRSELEQTITRAYPLARPARRQAPAAEAAAVLRCARA